ncbi:RNA polymerase sigma-70 factor [Phytoactinopolyspora mesophila]|uniref:RNA polymerase sigma-70 factor n=1 Tax=Phytoactinopolyspora mesophila TaxID=2650750 RepID=UPI001C9E4050
MTVLQHDELRPLMFSIAYRMLGSVAEAEDIVQDAFLRMYKSELDGTAIDSPDAFATTITTRLAIDALRSARVRREHYVGQWLPEPLITSDDEPARRVETDETISTAFLVLLETLAPVERAVFLLREVFGYGYDEIAGIVEKSESNCRQILARAKRAIAERRPRFEADRQHQAELAKSFLTAANEGNMEALHQLLADDVVFVGDGGGNAPALEHPVGGPVQVARFFIGLLKQSARVGMRIEPVEANGQPALRVFSPRDEVLGVLTFGVADGQIHTMHSVINPEKLTHLGQVGDLGALLSQPS